MHLWRLTQRCLRSTNLYKNDSLSPAANDDRDACDRGVCVPASNPMHGGHAALTIGARAIRMLFEVMTQIE